MVISYCTLLRWMCFSSNPQTIYRAAWSKCPGWNATILQANLTQGRTEERELGAAAFPWQQLVRETRLQPCPVRTENKGDAPQGWGEPEFSPTAAGEGGCGCSLGTSSLSLSLSPPYFWQGWQGKQAASSPGGAQGPIATASRTGTDLRSLS